MKSLSLPLALSLFTVLSSVGGTYAVIKANAAVVDTKVEMTIENVSEINGTMVKVYDKVNEVLVSLGRIDERLKDLEEK